MTRNETSRQLLKQFATKPGCEKFQADSVAINLLTEFLWLRQLSPTLSFEEFLDRYAEIVGQAPDYGYHAQDAVARWCPRSAKDAAVRELPQWSAAERLKALLLYSDMAREAEESQSAVPLTLGEFLEKLGPEIKAGAFDEAPASRHEAQPAPAESRAQPRIPAVTKTEAGLAAPILPTASGRISVRPTEAGQSIVYRLPATNGRLVRGVVETITQDDDRQYITFRTPTGERYAGVSILHCEVLADPLAPDAEPVRTSILWIPKAGYEQMARCLELTVATGNIALGDEIATYTHPITESGQVSARLIVRNGDQGPFVEAELVDAASKTLSSLPPRKELLGEFRLSLPAADAARLGELTGDYIVVSKVRGLKGMTDGEQSSTDLHA